MIVQNISKTVESFGYDLAGKWIEPRLEPKEYVEVPNKVGMSLIHNFSDKFAEYGKGHKKVDTEFPCLLCGERTFDRADKLGGHIRQKHGQEAFTEWRATQE